MQDSNRSLRAIYGAALGGSSTDVAILKVIKKLLSEAKRLQVNTYGFDMYNITSKSLFKLYRDVNIARHMEQGGHSHIDGPSICDCGRVVSQHCNVCIGPHRNSLFFGQYLGHQHVISDICSRCDRRRLRKLHATIVIQRWWRSLCFNPNSVIGLRKIRDSWHTMATPVTRL